MGGTNETFERVKERENRSEWEGSKTDENEREGREMLMGMRNNILKWDRGRMGCNWDLGGGELMKSGKKEDGRKWEGGRIYESGMENKRMKSKMDDDSGKCEQEER